MQKYLRERQGRRVLAVGVLFVILIAGAGVVATWRYEAALSRDRTALKARDGAFTTQHLISVFQDEREAITTYMATAPPNTLNHISALRSQFHGLAAEARTLDQTPGEDALLSRGITAEQRYFTQFLAARHLANVRHTYAGLRPAFGAIGRLEASAATVLPPLRSLTQTLDLRGDAAEGSAGSARTQALIIGLISIVLTIAAGVAFIAYAFRLLGQGAKREDKLMETLGRLSDRNALLSRLRSTSGVLGEVTLLGHWRMMLNPRYRAVGLLALPSMLVFDVLGPVIELSGYAVAIAFLLAGVISLKVFLLFMALAVGYGLVLTLGAAALEDATANRHPAWSDLRRIMLYVVGENLGYRQLLHVWRIEAFWQLIRGGEWGAMERKGLSARVYCPAVIAAGGLLGKKASAGAKTFRLTHGFTSHADTKLIPRYRWCR